MRIAIVTNILSPYRIPQWNALADHPAVGHVSVLCEGVTHSERSWLVDTQAVRFEVAFALERTASGSLLGQLTPGGLCAIQRMQGMLRRTPWDVLFVGGWSQLSALAAARTALRARKPYVLVSDGVRWPANLYSAAHNALKQWVTRNASGHIASCHRAMGYMMAFGASPWNQAVGAALCADVDLFADGADPNVVPTAVGVETTTHPIAVFVARFIPWKRGRDVIEAFAASHMADKGQLWIVGNGPQEPDYRETTERLGLSSQVTFIPFQQAAVLRHIYAAADVLVLASEQEPWGQVIQEAMCTGTPVIATGTAGAAEWLIQHGVNGWTYPPGDTEQLTTLLDQFADDPALKAKIGPLAREAAVAHSPAKLADEWVRVGAAVLSRSRSITGRHR